MYLCDNLVNTLESLVCYCFQQVRVREKSRGHQLHPLNESASTNTSIRSTPPSRALHIVAPKRLGRGVKISSLSKTIVEKVRQHFEKEREKGVPIKMSCVVERTVIATGLAVRTVFNIHKEFTSCDEHFLTAIKKYMLPPESGSTLTRLVGWLFAEWFMGFIYEKSILPSPKYWGRSRKLVHFQVVSSTYGVFFGRWVLRTLNEAVHDLFTNGACNWIKTYLPEDSTKIKRRNTLTLTFWRALYAWIELLPSL